MGAALIICRLVKKSNVKLELIELQLELQIMDHNSEVILVYS